MRNSAEAHMHGGFTGQSEVRSAILTQVKDSMALPVLAIAASGTALVVGCVMLVSINLDSLLGPSQILLAVALLGTIGHSWLVDGMPSAVSIALFGLNLIIIGVMSVIPEYSFGFLINAVFHRSLYSSLALICLGLPSFSIALYYLAGGGPRGYDISRYPVLVLPVALVLAAYLALASRLLIDGLPDINWQSLTTGYQWKEWSEKVYVDGWPELQVKRLRTAGMANHILGTLALMGMTSAISLPIGLGTGLFVSEYANKWMARSVQFSTTALRSISVFILGVTALSIVKAARGTPWADIFAGYYYDVQGNYHPGNGSFITASILLSFLVIPIIARATEEGCRSIPNELKEGSIALGASDAFTLIRIILPWSLPNVVTALLLGCAEVAGGAAVLLFIGSNGQYGVGPQQPVTSLDFLIFDAKYGLKTFRDNMVQYQAAAGLILVFITAVLSIGALLLKRSFSQRYRGV